MSNQNIYEMYTSWCHSKGWFRRRALLAHYSTGINYLTLKMSWFDCGSTVEWRINWISSWNFNWLEIDTYLEWGGRAIRPTHGLDLGVVLYSPFTQLKSNTVSCSPQIISVCTCAIDWFQAPKLSWLQRRRVYWDRWGSVPTRIFKNSSSSS